MDVDIVSISTLKKRFYVYVCLPTNMYVHHIHMQGPQRPEEGIRCPEVESQTAVRHSVGAENQTWVC